MRKPFLVVLLMLSILFSVHLRGQSVIAFGDVETGTTDSLFVKLGQTPSGDIALLSYYDAFQSAQTNHHTSEDSFKVYFSPTQNIRYNGELIIRFRGQSGSQVLKVVDLRGNGRLNDPYYASTFDRKDEALKNELSDIVAGHNSLGYSWARDEMFMDFDNWKENGRGASQNTLEGVYTGQLAVGYNDRQDAQSNYNFNTEHTFPQGTFDKDEPMRSDLHHLYPTKMYANSERGSKPFGMVSSASWSEGGSRSNSSTFEPRDAQKGRTARSMLYFLIRYQNYEGFVSAADQQVLMDWADIYPPDDIERNRNEAIYQLQNNRNPFVDYPQFLERIHNFIGTSSTPDNRSYALAGDTLRVYAYVMSSLKFFDFALVNNGNTNLTIDKVNTFSPDLMVDSFTQNITPGEDGQVHFSWNTSSATAGPIDIIFDDGDTARVIFDGRIITGVAHPRDAAIEIHPNPAKTTLQLSQPLDENATYFIYNVDGRLLQSANLPAGQNTISVNTLAPGFYLLKMDAGDGRITKKFVKQ